MRQTIIYNYLGTNGTIHSPVFLEGAYSTRSVRLESDKDKLLTKDGEHFYSSVVVPEAEVDAWKEVAGQ